MGRHCSCPRRSEGSSIGAVYANALPLERETNVKKCPVAIIALVMWLGVFGAASAAELPGTPLAHPEVAGAGGSALIPPFPAELFARTKLFFGSLRSDKR
jgi:hypothetical protein